MIKEVKNAHKVVIHFVVSRRIIIFKLTKKGGQLWEKRI